MNLKKPKFWDYKKPNIVAYILTPIALLINIFQFLNLYGSFLLKKLFRYCNINANGNNIYAIKFGCLKSQNLGFFKFII